MTMKDDGVTTKYNESFNVLCHTMNHLISFVKAPIDERQLNNLTNDRENGKCIGGW